jgi:hypothetical protein
MEKILIIREAAASLFSVSVQCIGKLVRRPELRCVRVGKRHLISLEVSQESWCAAILSIGRAPAT